MEIRRRTRVWFSRVSDRDRRILAMTCSLIVAVVFYVRGVERPLVKRWGSVRDQTETGTMELKKLKREVARAEEAQEKHEALLKKMEWSGSQEDRNQAVKDVLRKMLTDAGSGDVFLPEPEVKPLVWEGREKGTEKRVPLCDEVVLKDVLIQQAELKNLVGLLYALKTADRLYDVRKVVIHQPSRGRDSSDLIHAELTIACLASPAGGGK